MSDARLGGIAEALSRLASERQPEALLAELCREAQVLTDAAGAYVEITGDGSTPPRHAIAGRPLMFTEAAAAHGHGDHPLAAVRRDRRPVRLMNRSGAPEAFGLVTSCGPIFSFLAVPIAASSTVVGWIGVRDSRASDGFSERDEQALQILGIHAAMVLEVSAAREARQRLEIRLLQSQRVAVLGQLVDGIAHDFNNLLVAILGYAEFMRASTASDDHRHDLDQIIDAGHRAASLTGQLLAFGRRHSVEPRVLEVNPLVTATCSMLRRLLGSRITLLTQLGEDLPTIRTDDGLIQHVLVNLAVAAQEAMPSGGTLTIVTRAIDERDEAGESRRVVCIEVADTGPGMTEEIRRRVFVSSAESTQGAWFGVASAHAIVMAGGGRIAVQSELGRGTTFEIRLPAARPLTDDAPGAAAVRVPQGGSETILVVEDEAAVRNVIRTILSREGYTVVVAGDAAEARTRFASQPVALLFTDVVMPDGNGIDLYRELAAVQPALRVVYTSGHSDNLVFEGSALPAESVILKPFMPAAVVRKVRDTLDDGLLGTSG